MATPEMVVGLVGNNWSNAEVRLCSVGVFDPGNQEHVRRALRCAAPGVELERAPGHSSGELAAHPAVELKRNFGGTRAHRGPQARVDGGVHAREQRRQAVAGQRDQRVRGQAIERRDRTHPWAASRHVLRG